MIYVSFGQSGVVRHFFSDYTFLSNSMFVCISSASSFPIFAFAYYFLEVHKRRNLKILLGFGSFVALIVSITAFLDYNLAAKLGILSGFTTSTVSLAIGVTLSLSRFRPAYFYTLAWTTIMVANIYRMAAITGALPMNSFAEWGVFAGTVIETALISLALADKVRLKEKLDFERISKLNDDLHLESEKVRDMNDHLEELVEEQTREIKSIMKNIQLGIVVIKGDELLLTDTFSDAAKDILAIQDIAGRDSIEVLFSHAQLTKEVKDQVSSIMESCLGNDEINFFSNEHLLPLEAVFIFDGKEKMFQMDWKPVIDADDTVEKIIVTIKDVTSQKALELDAKRQQEELSYIGEILSVSSRQFNTFMSASIKFISDNQRLLKLNRNLSTDTLKVIFINLHTIKGAARALGFSQLTPIIHEHEQDVSDMMKGEATTNRDLCLQQHSLIEEKLTHYERLNSEKLGRNSAESVPVSLRLIESIHRITNELETTASPKQRLDIDNIQEQLESISYIDAKSLFDEVLADAEMLARDLAKEYPKIDLEAGPIRFSQAGQEIICNAFVHIIRNSMDHGIEEPNIRKAKGKDEFGHIKLSLEVEGEKLVIKYGDDGAGLNLKAIESMALKKDYIRDREDLSDHDKAELIFHSGFSTSASVNDISGRGVGMSAVREYFESHGGSVNIEIINGAQGVDEGCVRFQLVMNLPKSYFIERIRKIEKNVA